MMEPPHGPASAPSRYDDLLRQIVQLNTDLQKTAALSQSLQRERDGLQHNNSKATWRLTLSHCAACVVPRQLRDEVKRLHERCDKLQLVLVQETEQKIESDKKHEELIAKWKRQLELKARAFETLQKKFAPPKDLEQLRFQIQEELEGPHQQRVESLQDEIEKHRQFAFNVRREYEIVKTEHEQCQIDQANELECVQTTYEMHIADLKKKLQDAEERAQDSLSAETIRQLEQQRQAATVEVKLLHEELRDTRDELLRVHERCEQEKSETTVRLADELAKSAATELECKALSRQLLKLKDESASLRSKWDVAQSQLYAATAECEGLREQLRQKDTLVLSSHNAVTAKLREERSASEKEQAALKDRVSELTLKLQAAEALVQKASADSTLAKENEISAAEYAALLKAREDAVEKHRSHAVELEKKLASKEDALRRAQQDAEETIHRLQVESESARKAQQALEAEKEHYVGKQTSSQELLARMKTECVTLRTKFKDVENDYRVLQTKHREVIQYQEDVQLEKEQIEAKLKYVEQDLALLAEKLEKEKESHVAATRDLQRELSTLESNCRAQKAALRHETRVALSKALRELGKTQKKRDAYKRKCIEVHERLKALAEQASYQESQLRQLARDHAAELQHVLARLSEAESDKTALMQRQVELGVPLAAAR